MPRKVSRNNTKCDQCPLSNWPKVCSEAHNEAKVLILGESPGTTESAHGIPFHPEAAAGSILSYGMRQAGLRREICYLMNLISCQPPDNKLNSPEGLTALSLCKEGFRDELHRAIEENEIRVILALGHFPASAVGCPSDSTISEIRGYVFDYHGVPVIPTYHPSYIYRQRSMKGGSSSSLNAIWVNDLEKVAHLLKHGYTKPNYHWNMYPTLEDVKEFYDKVRASNCLISYDTETDNIKPHLAKIDLIGMADSATSGITIPFFSKGGAPYWHNGDFIKVMWYVTDILTHNPIMAHNLGFDVGVSRHNEIPIPDENLTHDTTLMWHIKFPGLQKNLNFIASTLTKTLVRYWKDVLKGRKGRHRDMEDSEFRWYNAQDCMNLFNIKNEILTEIEADPYLKEIYYNEVMPLVPAIISMTDNGMWIDPVNLFKWKAFVNYKLKKAKRELIALAELPKGFNINSDDDVRMFLFGIKAAKYKKVSELTATKEKLQFVWVCENCSQEVLGNKSKKPVLTTDCMDYFTHVYPKHKLIRTNEQRIISIPKMKSGTKKEQELLTLKDTAENIKPIYLLSGYRGHLTGGKSIAIDKLGILSLIRSLNNRLSNVKGFTRNPIERDLEITAIEKLLKWIDLFTQHNKWEKFRSTYTEYEVDVNGRVHTSFDQAGTETFRLSSKGPNLQNIPAKDVYAKRIRACFAAPRGWVFVNADYSQLEIVVNAYMTGDPELIAIIEQHLKIHDENTVALFHIDKESPKWSTYRKVAKIFQFASIQYGGQDSTIYEKVIAEVPDCGLTFAQFTQLKANYFTKYTVMKAWQEDIKRFGVDNGYVMTGFGSRRQLSGSKHDIEKMAMNTPIQGTAAQIVNRAMIKVYDAIKPYNGDIKLVMQVHDELILEVREDEQLITKAQEVLHTAMLAPVTFINGRTPMLEIECKVGKNWGECK